jgi:hypothetical protein
VLRAQAGKSQITNPKQISNYNVLMTKLGLVLSTKLSSALAKLDEQEQFAHPVKYVFWHFNLPL